MYSILNVITIIIVYLEALLITNPQWEKKVAESLARKLRRLPKPESDSN